MNTRNWVVGALAVAAIGASLFFLLRSPTEKATQVAVNVSEALGLRAGEEVAQLLGQKGRVAVIEMEIKPGQAPTAVAAMDKFRQTLKKQGIAVARTRAIPGGLTALIMGRGISQRDYLGLLEGSPGLDAVVTFAGLPDWPPDEFHQFQTTHPPVVVVDVFGVLKGPMLPALVDQKTVALAFTPRSSTEVQQQANEPKIFERYYRILRPPSK